MTPQDDKPKQAREWRAEDLGYDGWYIVDGHGNHPKNPSLFVESAAYEQAIKERDDILERYRAIELANKEMSRNDHVLFGSLLLERDEARAEAERLNIQAGIYSLEADKWKAMAEKMAAVLTDGYRGGFNFVIEEINAILAEFEAAKK